MSESRIQSYRDLDAWRVSMALCLLAYRAARELPASERFVLSSQLRRAAISIPSNVAEGQGCGEDGRYIHHVRIALGSLSELGTHFEIARRLGMLPDKLNVEVEEHLARTGQVLHGLLRSRLRKRRQTAGASALLACFGLWFVSLAVLG